MANERGRLPKARREALDERLRRMAEALCRHFSDDQILDLGMTATFASGWQRFIEAFGIVPDHWHDGFPPPFHAL